MTFDLNYVCVVCARLKRNSVSNLICIRIKESHAIEYSRDPPRDSISTESMNTTFQ